MLCLASSDKLLPLVFSTLLELFTSPEAHAVILSNQRHHLWANIGLKYTVLIERTAEMALKINNKPLNVISTLLDKSEKCAFGLHILMQILNQIGKEYRKCSEHYPLIIALSEYGDYVDLCNLLISQSINPVKSAFILHILNYIGHCKPNKFPKIVHYLLYHITSVSMLPLILNFVQSHYYTGVSNCPFSNLYDVLQMTFTASKQSEFIYTFFWENLCNLIQQEKQGRTVFLEQGNFTKAALQHVLNIIKFFEEILDRKLQNIAKKIIKEEKELSFKTTYYQTDSNKSSIFNMKTVCENQNHYSSICDNIARILEMLDINLVISNGNNRITLNNETYQKLIHVIVKYFFYSLLLRKPSRRRSSIIAIRLFNKCCSTSRIGRILTTQLLVDGAVFKYSLLFGATTPAYNNDSQSVSLFNLNIKQGFTSQMSQRPLAVFRNEMDLNRKTPSLITETCFQRQRLLLEALSAAMSENVLAGPSTDALTSLSLWLVESVSTDVMYNGLPWPEDEFTKITMERDLHIRRMFQSTPVLWSLLRFVAYHRPALCYCSVLLRGLTSVLIYQWLSWSYKSTPDSIFQELHDTTKNVLQTLTLAQLLPPPLDTLAEVIPKLKAFEISFVLKECVWYYMKENVPAPVLFQETQLSHYWRDPMVSNIPLRFIEPLRMVMQKHLSDLASNYNQIFIQGYNNRLNNLPK
uniref:Putative secreted protein n=1 Tax=Xenopsylla cheopis TaxID=163159 RepID=A0A6M2E029_XENCH